MWLIPKASEGGVGGGGAVHVLSSHAIPRKRMEGGALLGRQREREREEGAS